MALTKKPAASKEELPAPAFTLEDEDEEEAELEESLPEPEPEPEPGPEPEPKPKTAKKASGKDVYYRTTSKCIGAIHDPDTGVTFTKNLTLGPSNPKEGSFLQVQIEAGLIEEA